VAHALDDPAVAAETGAVLGLAAGDHRFDSPRPNQAPVLVVVVAAICDHALGSAPRSPDEASDGGHAVEQRDQLRDVVAVAAGNREREREPTAVDEEMMLGTGTTSVNRARARLGAPFFGIS